MKKKIKIFFIVVLVLSLVCLFGMVSSEEKIRKSLMQEIPIGTKKTVVEKYIHLKKYEVLYVSRLGFLTRDQNRNTLGTNYIQIKLFNERHFLFWYFNVSCYWIFDKDDKLIEINVWKEIDSI